MDVEMISTLIGNLGFPIFCVCGIFYLAVKFIPQMIQAINNNTIAIEKMTSIVERLERMTEGENNAES